jgi:hypothetical protein
VVYRGAGNDCGTGFHVWEGVLGEVEKWVDVGVECLDPLVSVILVSRSSNFGVLFKITGKRAYSLRSAIVSCIIWKP